MRETVRLPGTGISYTTTQGTHQDANSEAPLAEVAEPLPKGKAWRGWLWMALAVAIIVTAAAALTSCGEKTLAPASGFGTQITPAAPPVPDPRLVYELREKCGKDAQAWYHHYWEEDHTTVKDIKMIGSSFNSHYNERLNRCYVVVSSSSSLRDPTTKVTKFGANSILTDVLENKDLGEFFKFSDMSQPMVCNVGDSKCDSQQGFDALVASFMKE